MNAIFTVLSFLFIFSFATAQQSVSNDQIEAMLNGGKTVPTQLADKSSNSQKQVSNSQLESMLNSKSATTRKDTGSNSGSSQDYKIEAYRDSLGKCDITNNGYAMKIENTNYIFRCMKGKWLLLSK